jgi:hypothetical protein
VKSHATRPALLLAAALLLTAAVCLPIGRAADATALPEDVPQLTEPQQQAALEFVKEHHPQLNTLITRLKKREPAEYHKALDEVHSTLERLQRLQTRDPQRYEVDLKVWKVESRIRLESASRSAQRTHRPASSATDARTHTTGRANRTDRQPDQPVRQ